MTRAVMRDARGARSSLVLLLCVIALADAVDSEFTTNDTLPRDGISSWAGDDDARDDRSATAYGDAALNEKFSVSSLEDDFGMPTVRPETHSARVAISFGTRAPPLSGGHGTTSARLVRADAALHQW